MPSDLWQPKIELYLDAELSEPEMRAMDAHLRECPACAAQAVRMMQLKHATQLAARRYQPSAEFRRRITAQIATKSTTQPGQGAWRWSWAPALAISFVVLAAAGFLLNRLSQQARTQQLISELTDLHVANLAASTPVDVLSSDRHTVKPWFQGKLPFSFNLPELAGSPFILLGGRLTYLDHEPGAQLIYNIGAHHVSVFIFRDQPELDRAFSAQPSSRDVLNFHVESWSAGGLHYFVVGDASPQSIHQLTTLLQLDAHP